MSLSKSRSPRGSVVVQSFKGRLRLAWTYAKKRYILCLSLPDTPVNRTGAELKARLIERDIALDAFDSTLAKYQPATKQQGGITIVQLFDRFMRWKATKIDPRTIEKYQCLKVRLIEHFKSQSVSTIHEREAEQFRDWMLTLMQPITVQDRLSMLRACYRWGLKQGLVKENPWEEVKLKVPPKQAPKPFTLEEIKILIQAFRESRYYAHYADYVEFLFGTGCRSGEAIGLRWKHVAEDCSSCWIGEITTRNKVKAPKTNRPRTVPLTLRLQEVLLKRRPKHPDPEALVFPAPEGGPMDTSRFRGRPWKKVLERTEIPYRKPYITRSTLVSHALEQGMSPVVVAELTGHSVQVIYKNYAGNIKGRTQLPDILS